MSKLEESITEVHWVWAKILLPNPLQGTEQHPRQIITGPKSVLLSNSSGSTGDFTFHKPIWEACFSLDCSFTEGTIQLFHKKLLSWPKSLFKVCHKSRMNFLAILILLQNRWWFSHNNTNKRTANRAASQ